MRVNKKTRKKMFGSSFSQFLKKDTDTVFEVKRYLLKKATIVHTQKNKQLKT